MRNSLLLVLGLAIVLIVGVSTLAQGPRPGPPGGGMPLPPLPGMSDGPGRYTVAKVIDNGGGNYGFILLDTTTGDLYKANMDDAKPYSARPKPGPGLPPLPGLKDGPPPPPKDVPPPLRNFPVPPKDKDKDKKDDK